MLRISSSSLSTQQMEISRDQETWRREHRATRCIRSSKDVEQPNRRQGSEIGGGLGAYPSPQQRGHGLQGRDGGRADAWQSGGQPRSKVAGRFSAYATAGTREALAAGVAVTKYRLRTALGRAHAARS